MNSEPMFWKGKSFPAENAASRALPSGSARSTIQFHGRKTHTMIAPALIITAQRRLMTKSSNG